MVMLLPLNAWHTSKYRPFHYVARFVKIVSPVIMKLVMALLFLLCGIWVGNRVLPLSVVDLLGKLEEVYTSPAAHHIAALLTVWAVPVLCSCSVRCFLVWPLVTSLEIHSARMRDSLAADLCF